MKKANFQRYAKPAFVVGMATASVLVPEIAFATDYNVTDVIDEFDDGEVAVATVAAASMSLFVIRRVWKIIRGSI